MNYLYNYKNVNFKLLMKFFSKLIIALIQIIFVNLSLLRNLALRTKFQSLACSLFYKSQEVKKIDETINELASKNYKHDEVFIPSKQHKEILDKIKQYKDVGLQFLVLKN